MPEAAVIESPAPGAAKALDTNVNKPLAENAGMPGRTKMDPSRFSKYTTPVPTPEKKEEAKPEPKKEAVKADATLTPEEKHVRPGSEDQPKPEKPDRAALESEELTDKTPAKKAFQLANHYKSENAKLRKQLEDKSKGEPETLSLKEKLDARSRELESEKQARKKAEDLLRFRDYQNTDEFQEQYVKPFETAWSEAVTNLKGIKLTGDDGEERSITNADIQSLADMDIDVARQTIKKLVPDTTDAADVRRHVDNVRSQTQRHKAALEKAWTESEKWQKEQSTKRQKEIEDQQNTFKTLHEENSKWFKEFNDEDVSKIEYLQERENDDEWNSRLAKAKELAKSSLVSNPNNPQLSAEERRAIIRKNTAFINRAIAFGPLRLELQRKDAKLKEAEKKLQEYQASEPTNGANGKGKTTPQAPTDSKEERLQRLSKYVG